MLRPGIVALLTLFAHPLLGGVVLDGSFGTRGSLPGPNFMIQANFGRQVGGNLFQSFSQFNLNSSQSATFAGPANVQNILARVTSGSPSSIDGRISSQIPGANLFFMNPAGVLFGQHAQLDVSGSFAVTTANYLKLVGGGRFNANLGGGDVLTSAPVSAFGFLSSAPAPISISGSNTFDSTTATIIPGPGLNVAAGKSFSVVAGDISINRGYISGAGARVNLLSVKSPGEVGLDSTNITSPVDVTQFTAMGDINLTNLTLIDTSGPAGGPVIIRGGNFNLDSSQIFSNTTGPTQGGAIDITLSADLKIVSAAFPLLANIDTATSGAGNAGNITLTANSLLIQDNSIVSSDTFGSGNSGNVTVTANSLVIGPIGPNAFAVIQTDTFASGNAGSITMTANSLLVHNAGVSSFIGEFASGNTGNVTLIANSLVFDGGAVTTFVAPGGPTGGNAGNITLTANSLVIHGGFVDAETDASGNAGDVTVTANSLVIDHGSGVNTDTFGSGNAGNVTLTADSVVIAGSEVSSNTYFGGNGGNVTVQAGELTLTTSTSFFGTLGGQLSSRTFGSGNGGNVNVIADSILIDANSMPFATGIFANSVDASGHAGSIMVHAGDLTMIHGGEIGSGTFFGTGSGGNVNIIADSLTIDGTGGPDAPLTTIFADSTSEAGYYGVGSNTSGHAGNVTVKAGSLTLTNGGEISSSTSGSGDGGNVNVIADSLLVTGAGLFSSSGIFATAGAFGAVLSSGKAGNVTVQAGDLTISQTAQISSSTFGRGDGGTVKVTAGSLVVDGSDSGIFAVAVLGSSGTGGDVAVVANDLSLENGGAISAASFTSAAAGSVHLSLGTLTMDTDSSISSANTGSGKAGSVIIDTTGPVKLKHGSSISTLSAFGDAGSIDIISDGVIKLSGQSNITVSGGRNGGDIHITAPDLVYLLDSEITATAGGSGGSGTGGNITIDPQFIVLNNSLISANAAAGQGGNINLISDFFFNSNSSITATGTTSGTVNITAPALDLGAQLITLPISLLSAESQLQERCTALLRGDFSSFISIGRGGTEPAPEELQIEF